MKLMRAVKEGFAKGTVATLVHAAAPRTQQTAARPEGTRAELLRVHGPSNALAAPVVSPLTVLVHRGRGTTLVVGRYTLRIPPGAVPNTCSITLHACEEDGTVGCDILPFGVELEVPAVLYIGLRGTDARPGRCATICAWNPMTGGWEDLGGRTDTLRGVILTTVTRLSRFAVKLSSP